MAKIPEGFKECFDIFHDAIEKLGISKQKFCREFLMELADIEDFFTQENTFNQAEVKGKIEAAADRFLMKLAAPDNRVPKSQIEFATDTITIALSELDKIKISQPSPEKTSFANFFKNLFKKISNSFRGPLKKEQKPFTPVYTPHLKENAKKLKVLTLEQEIKTSNDPETIKTAFVELFNLNHKQAIALIKAKEPWNIANLLHSPGLDKDKLGEYLGEPEVGKQDANENSILSEYVKAINFSEDVKAIKLMEGESFTTPLRKLLEGFRLPGEAQKIARIMEAFANEFFKQDNKSEIANPTAAYILAYAVVMLNTDAHNPGVKTKMTKDQFIKNLKGVKDGEDFSPKFLGAIYDNITQNEIKLTEKQEHKPSKPYKKIS